MKQIAKNDIPILLNLGQAYEAEFSNLTHKIPDNEGLFSFDIPVSPYIGYLFYQDASPIGFCIVNTYVNPMDVAEFYIIPSRRRQKIGRHYAFAVFKQYPGLWQVRQIRGADHAIKFWRSIISVYTANNYKEEVVEDPDWGIVTRQIFSSVV